MFQKLNYLVSKYPPNHWNSLKGRKQLLIFEHLLLTKGFNYNEQFQVSIVKRVKRSPISLESCHYQMYLSRLLKIFYGDEVVWSNNVLSKFIFFFWNSFFSFEFRYFELFLFLAFFRMPFFRKKPEFRKKIRTKNKPYKCTKIFVRIMFFRKSFSFENYSYLTWPT